MHMAANDKTIIHRSAIIGLVAPLVNLSGRISIIVKYVARLLKTSNTIKYGTALLYFALAAVAQCATTIFIDLNATGANNGTSWANAYTHLSATTNANPGDTVEVSQGIYSYAADDIVTIPPGNPGSPITIKHSRTAGHNGLIEIDSRVIKKHWTVLDGAVVDNYETNLVSVWDTFKITNNLGFYFNGPAQLGEDADGGACIHLSGADVTNNIVKWCIINPQLHNPSSQDRYGIRVDAANNIDGVEIAYCLFTNVYDFAVFANQNDHGGFGGWSIHHSILERVAPPGFCKNGELASAGLGLDVYNCIINHFPLTICGEADNFQINYWWRMWNNVIFPGGNSTMQSEITAGTNYAHCYFYGNIICPNETNSPSATAGGSLQFNTLGYDSKPAALAAYGGTNIYIRDFRFFNNSIIGVPATGPSSFLSFLNKDFLFGWGIYIVPEADGILVYNNLLYTTNGYGFGMYPNYNGLGGDGGWKYNPGTVKVDYNVFGFVNYASNNLMGSFTPSAFSGFSGFTHNTSTKPALKNVFGQDFTPTDSTAIGAGINLALFATNMPGLLTDANGVVRGSSVGNWSLGALEPSGLMLHYDFSGNWVSSGTIMDVSSNSNDAIRYSSTNWPTLGAGKYNPNSATFTTDGPIVGQPSFNQGQYAAITNWGGIAYLTNGTVSAWAWFDNNSYAGSAILDAGYKSDSSSDSPQGSSSTNSWTLRRQQSSEVRFNIYKLSGGVEADNVLLFPDDTTNAPSFYGTTNWALYTVTWDQAANKLIGYYQGKPFATNTLNTPWLRIYSPSHWIGLGCIHHEGTAIWGDDLYPNNGWMGGRIDDVRIYNRALSSQEVILLAQSTDPLITVQPTSLQIGPATIRNSGSVRIGP